jgi:archaetidylinositol phosphate synthase
VLTKLKQQIQQMLAGEAKIAHKIGLTPNSISVIGFLLAFASAGCYALANQAVWLLLLAVFFLLASGFCDTMDGIVARTYKQTTAFGGFFDSVLDRFADGAAYAGIIIAGLCNAAFGSNYLGTLVALTALVASMLVSYTRARAEVIGVKMESIGIAERAERMLILAAVSIIGFFWLPALGYGVALIAVLSIVTVVQRVLHVYKQLKKA